MRMLHIYLPDNELYESLKKIADIDKRSLSEIVRRILKKYVEEEK